MARIDVREVSVCKDAILPCLEFRVAIEDIDTGDELMIPIDGRLYSDDNKFLTLLTLNEVGYKRTEGCYSSLTIGVGCKKIYKGVNFRHSLELKCRGILDPKILKHIEERRRSNEYHAVELRLGIRFLKLHSDVARMIEILERRGSDEYVGLLAGSQLLGIPSNVYEEVHIPIKIEERKWVKDFLPYLGLGKYTLIEFPSPKILTEVREFEDSLKALEEARKLIYETLKTGPPLTALRNALAKLCDGMRRLGLAKTANSGCTLDDDKVKHLFKDNKELANIVIESFRGIKQIATTGPEPTQPHLAPRPALELCQVECLIGIAAYIFKLIMDALTE